MARNPTPWRRVMDGLAHISRLTGAILETPRLPRAAREAAEEVQREVEALRQLDQRRRVR